MIILRETFSHINTGIVRSIGSGNKGLKDGIAEEAEFNTPSGISHSESDGSLLVCDYYNHKIRKITFEGILKYQFLSLLICDVYFIKEIKSM